MNIPGNKSNLNSFYSSKSNSQITNTVTRRRNKEKEKDSLNEDLSPLALNRKEANELSRATFDGSSVYGRNDTAVNKGLTSNQKPNRDEMPSSLIDETVSPDVLLK